MSDLVVPAPTMTTIPVVSGGAFPLRREYIASVAMTQRMRLKWVMFMATRCRWT